MAFYRRENTKRDGRKLYLYGTAPHVLTPLGEGESPTAADLHMRWHPLRQEWVVYAAHRQDRTFHPPEEFCPLCPSRRGGYPTEIPFESFEVAVFENRFPALHPQPPQPPDLAVPTAPARGACEVIVYTPDHVGSLWTLGQDRRKLLVEVWVDRYRELYGREEVQFVLPFENRGEIVGVTLHHPHGQLYAYPFVPPVIHQEAMVFRRGPVLSEILEHAGQRYIVVEDPYTVAIVPPFVRYPYEVWVIPRQAHPGPWTFGEEEVASFARMLGEVVARYDALFDKPFPYVMVLHAAPKGEQTFHFHAEFYPPLRSADRLKFLAGTELGAGVFVVDAFPEQTAQILREIRKGI